MKENKDKDKIKTDENEIKKEENKYIEKKLYSIDELKDKKKEK